MTVVVAMVTKDRSYIASDSLWSNTQTGTVYKNKKIFKLGDILVGGSGSYKQLQMVETEFTPPVREKNQTAERYMTKTFVRALKEFLKDNNLLEELRGVLTIDGSFLFVYEGEIYYLNGDLALLNTTENIDAIGSGKKFAQGALHVLNTVDNKLTDRQKLKKAVDTAASHVVSVGGPVHIISMNKGE